MKIVLNDNEESGFEVGCDYYDAPDEGKRDLLFWIETKDETVTIPVSLTILKKLAKIVQVLHDVCKDENETHGEQK